MRILLPLLLTIACAAVQAQTTSEQRVRPLRVMAWNVENLYDTIHDEGFQDQEFLPESERHWTSHRLWQKMTEMARVIVAVGEDGGLPDLVGLCEVENDSVLKLLTKRSVLRQLGYHYVMTHSEDRRGIDVALLYQPARFGLIDNDSIRVPSRENGLPPTRDILHVRGRVITQEGIDTLHVMVVHLPSRTGGHENDRLRSLAARVLWTFTDSLVAQGKKVVVMGDFNASTRDRLFRRTSLRLTDDRRQPGTYCFRGNWQWLDHVLVSPSLATQGMARPISLSWLLEPNKTNGNVMPRRTFRGPSYHGGISDHLPVILDLKL